MNTLIKIILTTVIGFVGTITEINDSQVNIQAEVCRDIQITNYEKNGFYYCCVNERSFKMLKYKFDS